MTTRLKPLGNRVILRKIEEDSRSGGIAIPKTIEQDEGTQEYEVVEAPDDGQQGCSRPSCRYDHSPAAPLHVGFRVHLARHRGWKIVHQGEELYAADIDDLLAIEVETEKEVSI